MARLAAATRRQYRRSLFFCVAAALSTSSCFLRATLISAAPAGPMMRFCLGTRRIALLLGLCALAGSVRLAFGYDAA